MRRITTNYIGYWSLGFRQPINNATVIDRRDYRLLLRVAKAAERLLPWDYSGELNRAFDALNKRSTKP